MAFYVKPPRGFMQLANLEALTWQRFNFLLAVESSDGSVIALKDVISCLSYVEESDALIEGSHKDIISHFMTRLACAQDKEMEKFLIRTETRLFNYRISCMTKCELMQCVKPLRRLEQTINIAEHNLDNEMVSVMSLMECVLRNYDWKTVIRLYDCDSSDHFVSVPFDHVPDLVRKRLVTLDRGQALVPCSKLANILVVIFRKILERGCRLSRNVIVSLMEEDQRIAELLRSLRAYFEKVYGACIRSWDSGSQEPVHAKDIEDLVVAFPPCMSNLHARLRSTQRLQHFSRIQYTLFLKEVGLPIHEAVRFWRSKYSRAPSSQQSASKTENLWQSDGKRYTYNIRHLYGLEGAKNNYRGHCCASLQEELLGSGGFGGGCPFKHFDKHHLLQNLLSADLPMHDIWSIIKLCYEELRYNDACRIFLLAKSQRTNSNQRSSVTCNEHVFNGNRMADCVRKSDEYRNYRSADLRNIEESGYSLVEERNHGNLTGQLPSTTSSQKDVLYNNRVDNIDAQQPTTDLPPSAVAYSQPSVVSSECSDSIGKKSSCDAHNPCPCTLQNRNKDGMRTKMQKHFAIKKPIDYYLSYKDLMNGLK